MRKEIITIKKGKTEIIINLFFNCSSFMKNREKFIEEIVKKTSLESIGYVGFKSRKFFKEYLKGQIINDAWIKKEYPKVKEQEIIGTIKSVFKKIEKIIFFDKLFIFIFPTLSEFVIKNMGGIGGYSPWKKTILIDFYPGENWKNQLKIMLAHETAHAISPFCHELTNLRSWLVFEGVAEHFRETFIGGKRSPWTSAITKEEAINILRKLLPLLNSEDHQLYNDLFFGSDKYPIWSGYTISYYLIEEYLKGLEIINWKQILNMHPEDVPIEKLFSSYGE